MEISLGRKRLNPSLRKKTNSARRAEKNPGAKKGIRTPRTLSEVFRPAVQKVIYSLKRLALENGIEGHPEILKGIEANTHTRKNKIIMINSSKCISFCTFNIYGHHDSEF